MLLRSILGLNASKAFSLNPCTSMQALRFGAKQVSTTSSARYAYTTRVVDDPNRGAGQNRRQNTEVKDILVQKLNWTTGKKQLMEYMSQFGKVRDVRIQYNFDTGLSKGFGYVTMENKEGVQKALEQIDHELDNTRILVKPPFNSRGAFLNKGTRKPTSIRTSEGNRAVN